jgi:hypothetical protein
MLRMLGRSTERCRHRLFKRSASVMEDYEEDEDAFMSPMTAPLLSSNGNNNSSNNDNSSIDTPTIMDNNHGVTPATGTRCNISSASSVILRHNCGALLLLNDEDEQQRASPISSGRRRRRTNGLFGLRCNSSACYFLIHLSCTTTISWRQQSRQSIDCHDTQWLVL